MKTSDKFMKSSCHLWLVCGALGCGESPPCEPPPEPDTCDEPLQIQLLIDRASNYPNNVLHIEPLSGATLGRRQAFDVIGTEAVPERVQWTLSLASGAQREGSAALVVLPSTGPLCTRRYYAELLPMPLQSFDTETAQFSLSLLGPPEIQGLSVSTEVRLAVHLD